MSVHNIYIELQRGRNCPYATENSKDQDESANPLSLTFSDQGILCPSRSSTVFHRFCKQAMNALIRLCEFIYCFGLSLSACAVRTLFSRWVILTHLYLTSHKWDIDKQHRPKSDVVACGSTLFFFNYRGYL